MHSHFWPELCIRWVPNLGIHLLGYRIRYPILSVWERPFLSSWQICVISLPKMPLLGSLLLGKFQKFSIWEELQHIFFFSPPTFFAAVFDIYSFGTRHSTFLPCSYWIVVRLGASLRARYWIWSKQGESSSSWFSSQGRAKVSTLETVQKVGSGPRIVLLPRLRPNIHVVSAMSWSKWLSFYSRTS